MGQYSNAKGNDELAKRKRRRNIDGDVQDAIERLIIETDWGGSQIERHLLQDDLVKDRLPILRTIQDMVKELRPPDPSGVWTTIDAEPETIGPILDVLASAVEFTEGRVTTLTNAEASWVIRIHSARPDLPPADIWYIVRFYVVRELNKDGTDDLDLFLAFAPWRSPEHELRYHSAREVTGIPAAPLAIHQMIQRGDAFVPNEDGTQTQVILGALSYLPEAPEDWRRQPIREQKETPNG